MFVCLLGASLVCVVIIMHMGKLGGGGGGYTLSVCSFGSNDSRRPLANEAMSRDVPVLSVCVALLSNSLTSRVLKMSFAAS